MLTDIEIAQAATPEDITVIADAAGIAPEDVECYGKTKAKIDYNLLRNEDHEPGKLILVTAINPTPAGEGKTTTTVGLGDALSELGKKTVIALREPSLGPVFGIKGGAAGGGYAQVIPMEDINLHFTGDMHAITASNNLLCALLDTRTLADYLALCDDLGLAALVEAHDEKEVASAVAAGARIIGGNNRNLRDFSVNLDNAARLRDRVPPGVLYVAESGVRRPADVAAVRAMGADGGLIGEALMRAKDKSAMLNQFRRSV
mgnify:CR=1 FL=1